MLQLKVLHALVGFHILRDILVIDGMVMFVVMGCALIVVNPGCVLLDVNTREKRMNHIALCLVPINLVGHTVVVRYKLYIAIIMLIDIFSNIVFGRISELYINLSFSSRVVLGRNLGW